MFMLIDCDNFFVSCERIFQPKLKNRPVVVLSNNDGCVVSRSYEAKALDIPMCCPFFKIENFFKRNNGIALSSNYELYADISRRVMALLRFRFGEIETYSIDEAFVKVSDRNNFFTLASNLRQDILNQIGIPVSIGIAKTKTLCKIASKTAKKTSSSASLQPNRCFRKLSRQQTFRISGEWEDVSPPGCVASEYLTVRNWRTPR